MKIHTHALKSSDRAAINDFLNRIHPQDAQAASDFLHTSDVKVGVFDDGMNLIAIVFGNRSNPNGTFYISANGYDASRTVTMVTQVIEKQQRAGSSVSHNAATNGQVSQQQPKRQSQQQFNDNMPQLHKPSASNQHVISQQQSQPNYPNAYGQRSQIATIKPNGQSDNSKNGKKGKKKVGKAKKIVISLIVIAALGGIAAGGVYLYPRIAARLGIKTSNENDIKHWQIAKDKQATLTIDSGDTVSHVKTKLYKIGFASTADIITDYLTENNKLENLQAGTYTLVGSEKPKDIIDRLVNGVTTPTTVVGVNVGNTLNDIAATIDTKKLKFTGADFLAYVNNPQAYKASYQMMSAIPDNLPSIEGFIPAGVYNLSDCNTPEDAIKVMLDAGEKRYAASGQTPEQWWQNLIIGSMIEKEAMFDEDRANISSVIHNRLAQNMKLGIDATVKYATGKSDARVYDSDTQVDSPYNTYKVTGLPIGPICSAISDKSMEAAANPAQTDYLYYVLKDKEGHHSFSNNAAQFEQDKQAYLQLFGYQ